METDISIWLIPKLTQRQELQNIIDELAKKYGAYPFIPHITVYYLGTSMALDQAIKILDEETVDIGSFNITAETMKYSDVFTKTLYIQYQIDPPLRNYYEKLRTRFKSAYDYQLNPHLSLIYKNNLADADKQIEIDRLSYPQILTIDQVAIITRQGSIISQEKDILDWKIAFQKNL